MENNIFRFNNIEWSMPFLFTGNSSLIPIFYHFFKNKSIKYVYGSPKCLWSGGRLSHITSKNIKFIEEIIYNIKKYNVTPSFTFTNTNLTKEMLDDKFCNELLRLINESNSEIILVSDLLYKHIKNKYPNIKLCASVLQSPYQIIKNKNESEHINKLTNKYDRVVIRPEYAINNNGDFSAIKDISKIELIVNQNCAMNCYCSNSDYKLIEMYDKGVISKQDFEKEYPKVCPRDNGIIKEINTLPNYLTNKCIEAGITKLKLNGRHLRFNDLLIALKMFFFSEEISENELQQKIDDYILSFVKNNADMQLYSLLCKRLLNT